MPQNDPVLAAYRRWYASLKTYKASGGPARGTIAVALMILQNLKDDDVYSPTLDAQTAEGGMQIRRATGPRVKRILAEHGETRSYLSEGGRTNRGGPGEVDRLLVELRSLKLDALDRQGRSQVLHRWQEWLVEEVRAFHGRKRLTPGYNPQESTRHFIAHLLSLARDTGKEGPVAQYLVGAKLQLRFPDEGIGNMSANTADVQLGRSGDFDLGDTTFHVTVAPPTDQLIAKCEQNARSGLQAYLLVPERIAEGARQLVRASSVASHVTVQSVEGFVAQNVDELSAFDGDLRREKVRELLAIYNERVDETELDKSMLVDVPKNL